MRRLALLLVAAGCAAGPPETRPPEAPDAHAEIARLEGRIEVLMRNRLGSARSPDEPPAIVQPPEPKASAPARAKETPAEEPHPSEAAPAQPMEPPRPEAPRTEAMAPPPAKASRRPWRCGRISQAADEICDASGRICRLAGEIADAAAWRSCARAQRDCTRSRQIADACQ
jgi:hypothetical protein